MFNKRSIHTAGWFELGRSSDGQFCFVLKGGNGETIFSNELHKPKDAAVNGIASVQANCAIEERYEWKTSLTARRFFNLKAANHRVIGTSQMYSSSAPRDDGMASVKANGSTPTIKDNA